MKSEIMDCEKYLSKLYKESKFCNCENLIRFAYLDEKKKNLRNLCWDLSESLNDIHKGNFEVSELYEKKLSEFVNFSNEHNLELNLLIKNNKLKLYYHNEKNNYHKQPVTYERVEKLLNKKKIVSAHCSNCNQLIAPISKK